MTVLNSKDRVGKKPKKRISNRQRKEKNLFADFKLKNRELNEEIRDFTKIPNLYLKMKGDQILQEGSHYDDEDAIGRIYKLQKDKESGKELEVTLGFVRNIWPSLPTDRIFCLKVFEQQIKENCEDLSLILFAEIRENKLVSDEVPEEIIIEVYGDYVRYLTPVGV